jgi:hypothetical protein
MPVKARAGGQGRVRGGRVGAQQGTGGTPSPPAPDPSFGTAAGSSTVSGAGSFLTTLSSAGAASGAATVSGVGSTYTPPSWVGATWSPTDHNSMLGISGTNNEVLTRLSQASPNGGARSDTAQTTGQRYVEFDITTALAPTGTISDIWLGAANGAQPLDSFPFPIPNAVVFANDGGGIRTNDSVNDPGFNYGQGDVIGMLLDLDANTVKFRKNGGTYTAAYDIAYMRPSADTVFIYANIGGIFASPNPVITFGNVS